MSQPGTSLPENARCPRCGGDFRCGASEGHCDCFELRLEEGLRQRLAARYSGCLCMACLRELAQPAALTQPRDSPPS
ncbi:cysteine-rich CWC family protein [Roseateles sp.]|jgi:hypothetical protein|uniref:cysteine-rich CWC family protein n=1 Tax=Roseateles sp. TaxID=1971397 RepID=UPI00391D277C